MTEAIALTVEQKMALMQMKGNAGRISLEDRYNDLKQSGLPLEAIGALTDLSMKTAKTIAGEVIDIGKIIVMKILDFVKENPTLSIGIAIGGAIGALAAFIPFIGPFIAPLSIGLGAAAGAVIGNQISGVDNLNDGVDKIGELADSPITTTLKNAIDIGKKFFQLLKDILVAIFNKTELN